MSVREIDWQARAKCLSLTAEEVDALFFPSSGGKPHRAKRFCSDCPVQALCLQNAIDSGSQGFHSGTTEEERRRMGKNNRSLEAQLASTMPIEPDRRRPRYRRIIVNEDPHSWLGLRGPTEAQIQAQQNFLVAISD